MHCIFLLPRICICFLINIEAYFLLNIGILNAGIRRFLQYFLVFFPVSKRKSFFLLHFLKFQGSIDSIFPVTEIYYQCECRLEKKIIYLETKNFLLRIIHFTDDIYLLKVNIGNMRTICEICSKLKIKTPKWSQWRLGLNFKHLQKNFVFTMLFIYIFPFSSVWMAQTLSY